MENTIIKKYTTLIMTTMKNGDKKKAEVYKLVKSKLMEFVTQKNAPVLDEKSEVTILNKMVKERQDTAEVYKNANRPELAEKELYEASVISEHLPKAALESDIITVVDKFIAENPGLTKKDMGKVIKFVKESLDNVDGKLCSTIVSSKLS